MNTYNVVVTVSTTVCIDAESPDDAIEKVSQALNNGDVNMSTDIANNIGYSMLPLGRTLKFTVLQLKADSSSDGSAFLFVRQKGKRNVWIYMLD